MVSSYPHHTPLYKHELNCEDVIHNPILYKRLGPFILMCVHSFIYGTIVAAGWKQIHVILFQAHFHWYFCLKRLFSPRWKERKGELKYIWHQRQRLVLHVLSYYKNMEWRRRRRVVQYQIYQYVIRHTNISLRKTKMYT